MLNIWSKKCALCVGDFWTQYPNILVNVASDWCVANSAVRFTKPLTLELGICFWQNLITLQNLYQGSRPSISWFLRTAPRVPGTTDVRTSVYVNTRFPSLVYQRRSPRVCGLVTWCKEVTCYWLGQEREGVRILTHFIDIVQHVFVGHVTCRKWVIRGGMEALVETGVGKGNIGRKNTYKSVGNRDWAGWGGVGKRKRHWKRSSLCLFGKGVGIGWGRKWPDWESFVVSGSGLGWRYWNEKRREGSQNSFLPLPSGHLSSRCEYEMGWSAGRGEEWHVKNVEEHSGSGRMRRITDLASGPPTHYSDKWWDLDVCRRYYQMPRCSRLPRVLVYQMGYQFCSRVPDGVWISDGYLPIHLECLVLFRESRCSHAWTSVIGKVRWFVFHCCCVTPKENPRKGVLREKCSSVFDRLSHCHILEKKLVWRHEHVRLNTGFLTSFWKFCCTWF